MRAETRRSKARHVDARQEWVVLLREKKLFVGKWIPGKRNVSNLGTKIQTAQQFVPERGVIMFELQLQPVLI